MGTGVSGDMPADQRFDDGLCLVFETRPLEADVEILGNPELLLVLASDMPQAQVAARLCDVAPDGSSLRVSYAVLNLTHRDGSEAPHNLQPNVATEIAFRLKACGHRFPAGHRIRLALSTAYWPLIWPARDAATLTLHCASSRLSLPVRDGGGEVVFAPPLHGTPTPTTKLDDGHVARSVSFDLMTGTASYVTVGQGGLFGEGVLRWDEIGTTLSHDLERRMTIGTTDPLSADSTIVQTYRHTGNDFAVRIETVTSLRADRETFTLSGTMTVYEGDGLVHSREWIERIPRDHV